MLLRGKHEEVHQINIQKDMNKDVIIKTLCVLLYVLIVCVLSVFFSYMEWNKMLYFSIFFLPFPILLATEKALYRLLGLFGFWAVLLFVVIQFNSLFTHIIIVDGDTSYTVEKIRKGKSYDFVDSEGYEKPELIQENCVYNKTDRLLRLTRVSYSRYRSLSGENGEIELMEIPPHSLKSIPAYPDYILESPPNSIFVRKHGNSDGNEKTFKIVLK
jgi:hypothetical protein